MPKSYDKHKHSSKKIRANKKVFVNSDFEKQFNRTNSPGRVICHNDLDLLRKNEKSVVATITRYSTNKIKSNYKISEDCVEVIRNNYQHNNPYVVGFIGCIITSYNEASASSPLINLSAVHISKKDPKNMKQTKKNCEKTITSYIQKITSNMKTGQWENVTEHDIAKYEAIAPAVRFFCNYITYLLIGNIPDTISKEDYRIAYEYDKNIAKYYSISKNNNCYYLNKKTKNKGKKFNQQCITFLFCKYTNVLN